MSRALAALTACLMAGFLSAAHAQTFKVLYNFQGGNDGAGPSGGPLIADAAGNLYGTTVYGGGYVCSQKYQYDCGTVFRVAPDGTETVLHAFRVRTFAENGVIADAKGNLYGSGSDLGGKCPAGHYPGCGTIFRLTPDGRFSSLYKFQGTADGMYPGGLIRDQAHNLYGTTAGGGAYNVGTVFKLAPDRTLTVLHTFTGGNDGCYPVAPLIQDSAGNFYGTTSLGGRVRGRGCFATRKGYGTVFKIAPDGTKSVLYAFRGHGDGAYPASSLVMDQAGNLFGSTEEGGIVCHGNTYGCGTLFKVTPNGTKTTLYTFQGGSDGYFPLRTVVMDGAGNLYGATLTDGVHGYGAIFRFAPDGSFTTLHAFDGSDGANPSGVMMDATGNIYGSTDEGGTGNCNNGYGCGVVYELTP